MNDRVEKLKEYCQSNDRVCPQPQKWANLYDVLSNTKQLPTGGWEPALPLILAAWYEAPTLFKMMRLKEHIDWSASHSCFDKVEKFLYELREEDWFHIGE